MPAENVHQSTGGWAAMNQQEEKMEKRLSRCISSPLDLCDMTHMAHPKNKAPKESSSSYRQKVLHPLTAKLLAETRAQEQVESTHHCRDGSSRHRMDALTSRTKLEGLKPTRRESETRSQLHKQQSFPESPIPKSKGMRHHRSNPSSNKFYDVRGNDPVSHECARPMIGSSHSFPESPSRRQKLLARDTHTDSDRKDIDSYGKGLFHRLDGDVKTNECPRPKIGASHSFPESPTRRQKAFQPSIHKEPSKKDNDTSRNLSRQFNIELRISAQNQSSSERQKSFDPPNKFNEGVQSDMRRNSYNCNNVAHPRSNEPRRCVTMTRRDETNVAISNYFTPRHPTPQRCSDPSLRDECHLDDSACWHVNPNAFDSGINLQDVKTNNRSKKPVKCLSSSNERFL
jgi:hypothetical protein